MQETCLIVYSVEHKKDQGILGERGSVTVAWLRTRLGTSRKYALTVLECFDTIKFTQRRGDARALLDPPKTTPPRPPEAGP